MALKNSVTLQALLVSRQERKLAAARSASHAICSTAQSVNVLLFGYAESGHEALAVQKAKRRQKNSTPVIVFVALRATSNFDVDARRCIVNRVYLRILAKSP